MKSFHASMLAPSSLVAFSAVAIWAFLAHVGMSRRAVPTLADTIIVFLTPVPLLFGNTFVGQKEIWPWFYYAAGYLAVSVVTVHWQLRLLLKQPELASFRILYSPLGPLSVLYVGVPFYALAGWLDQHGPLPPVVQTVLALSAGPPAVLFSWLFFRDWQKAIAATDKDNSADYSTI